MDETEIFCEVCGQEITKNCDWYYEIPIEIKSSPRGAYVDTAYICQDCWDEYVRKNFEHSTF